MSMTPAEQAQIDARFMAQALALGRRGLGRTAPNPAVGALVVRHEADGPRVVGRGFTQPGGRPHAEAMAFADAGLQAVGATLYVTLEPCAHRSVRGAVPCVEHTILSGVRRVVSAMDDPNPRIAGLGHALLRSAGITTTIGIGREEAMRSHRGHVARITENRPMVTLKIARTADNYAGTDGPMPLRVSCEAAMAWVHVQRAQHDVIMLGIGSVAADDPQLTVRLAGLEDRSPVRVVLDTRLALSAASRLVRTAAETPLWVIAGEHAPPEAERYLRDRGVEVMRVGLDAGGRLSLHEALALLAARGVTRVFSEGGPTVAYALASAGLADDIVISTSPHALLPHQSGRAGTVAVSPGLADLLADPARYRCLDTRIIGCDHFQTYERIATCSPG